MVYGYSMGMNQDKDYLADIKKEPKVKVDEIDSNGVITYHNYPKSVADMIMRTYKGAKIVHRKDGSILIDNTPEARREVRGPVDEY